MPSSNDTEADVTQSPTGEKVDQESSAGTDQLRGAGKSREERVREAAYRRFLERGSEHGKHDEDWGAAENEIGLTDAD